MKGIGMYVVIIIINIMLLLELTENELPQSYFLSKTIDVSESEDDTKERIIDATPTRSK